MRGWACDTHSATQGRQHHQCWPRKPCWQHWVLDRRSWQTRRSRPGTRWSRPVVSAARRSCWPALQCSSGACKAEQECQVRLWVALANMQPACTLAQQACKHEASMTMPSCHTLCRAACATHGKRLARSPTRDLRRLQQVHQQNRVHRWPCTCLQVRCSHHCSCWATRRLLVQPRVLQHKLRTHQESRGHGCMSVLHPPTVARAVHITPAMAAVCTWQQSTHHWAAACTVPSLPTTCQRCKWLSSCRLTSCNQMHSGWSMRRRWPLRSS